MYMCLRKGTHILDLLTVYKKKCIKIRQKQSPFFILLLAPCLRTIPARNCPFFIAIPRIN